MQRKITKNTERRPYEMNQIVDLQDFELEFCLAPSAYNKVFPDEGALWAQEHTRHLAMFHRLFATHEGRKQLAEDIKVLCSGWFPSKNGYRDWFDRREYSLQEWRFLMRHIKRSKTKWYRIATWK